MCARGQSFVRGSELPQPLYRSRPGGSPAAGLLSMQIQRAPRLPLSLQSSRGIPAGPAHFSEGSFPWFRILWSLSEEAPDCYAIVRARKHYKVVYGLILPIFNILTLNYLNILFEWRFLHKTKWTTHFTMLKIFHLQGRQPDPCQVLPPFPMLTQCHLHPTKNITAGLVSKHKERKMLLCQLLHSFLADCRCTGVFYSALNNIKPKI